MKSRRMGLVVLAGLVVLGCSASPTDEGDVSTIQQSTDEVGGYCPAPIGCLQYPLDKVYDPTHALIYAPPCGTCCIMSQTGEIGHLRIGLSPAVKWDFCVPGIPCCG